jgi:hypothetical protein
VTPERIVVLEWPNGAMSVEEYDQNVGRDLQTRREGVVRCEYVRADVADQLVRDAVRLERLDADV